MTRLVNEYSDAIERRRRRGIPLEASSEGHLFLNVCKRCLLGMCFNTSTLLDHPTVRISNIYEIDGQALQLANEHAIALP